MHSETSSAITIIANPGAGKSAGFEAFMSETPAGSEPGWNVLLADAPEDVERLAKEAVKNGAGIVAAYGGDGTVSAVADAVSGTDAVLGIIPGGTGNAFARELGIPLDAQAAARLLVEEHSERWVDMGLARFDDGREKTFILRASVGLAANAVDGAVPEDKAKLGEIAYFMAALREMKDPPVAHYTLESGEGQRVELDGLFAELCNSGEMGMGNAQYAPGIRIDDGVLDGIIGPTALTELVGAAAAAFAGGQSDHIERLNGSTLRLVSDPPQQVSLDGDIEGFTPVTVIALPSRVRVVVPNDDGADETGRQKETK